MIRLSTQTTQTVRFIPRRASLSYVEIINETTNSVMLISYDDFDIYIDDDFVDNVSGSLSNLDNYSHIDIQNPNGFLKEGGTYLFKAYDSASNVLFYDKVFVTDQTDYTINKDEFKSYSQSETYKTFKG